MTTQKNILSVAAKIGRHATGRIVLLGLCLLLIGEAQAVFINVVTGYVYARTLVRGPTGEPILVEYADDGTATVRGEMTGEWQGAKIASAAEFNALVEAFQTFREQHKDGIGRGATLMNRAGYNSATFQTLDGRVVNKPGLSENTHSVFVRGQRTILTTDTNPVLFESPISLSLYANSDPPALKNPIRSVLIRQDDGTVLETSALSFGYQVAYGMDGEDGEECTNLNALPPGKDTKLINLYEGQRPCGPVTGAEVQAYSAVVGDVYDWTNSTGRFSLTIPNPICPFFYFEYTNYVYLYMYYTDFNPKRQGAELFFAEPRTTYAGCNGYGIYPFLPNLSPTPAHSTVRFPVDVIVVTGIGNISNQALKNLGDNQAVAPIAFGETRRGTDIPVFSPHIPIALDLDADGVDDKAMLHNGEVYVYLGGRNIELDPDSGAPINEDLKRLPDQLVAGGLPDITHQGLVTGIAAEDLQATDLYVYRVATGEKIAGMRGLKENEFRHGLIYEGDDPEGQPAAWSYRIMLATGYNARSAEGAGLNVKQVGWRTEHLEDVKDNRLTQQANHLREGESLQIIAINRKTGYIGSLITTLNAPQGGKIDFPIEPITLRPPNLRISAERKYEVQAGLTQGEDRNYLIGFEGSGLTSDQYIAITTEWFDQDGRPLPADLPGYTGRLAQIVDVNTLGQPVTLSGDTGDVSQVGHFEIKPGRRLQLVALNGTDLQNKHYYLHVSGEAKDENVDFSTLGAGEGVLEFRPRYHVPFQVPVYSEKHTNEQKLAYNQAVKAELDAEKPVPVYIWAYRPEMQFSVFDLEKLQLRYEQDNGPQIIDLTKADAEEVSQVLASSDYVDLLYEVLMSDLAPLQSFGPERELILAIGEQEVQVKFGPNGEAHFDNLEHLALLHTEDYLFVSLYQNSDPENILWEFGFVTLNAIADMNNNGEIVKSDELNSDKNNSENQPLLMWVNDDNDDGEINEGKGAGGDIPGDAPPDYANNQIDGMRDLVDFFPVHLDIQSALDYYPFGLYTYRLANDDAAFKYTETSLKPFSDDETERPDAILKKADIARQYASKPVQLISSQGIALSNSFLFAALKDNKSVILIEAAKVTASPTAIKLEIVGKGDGKVVASGKLNVAVSTVENMYRHINLQDVAREGGESIVEGLPNQISDPSNNPDKRTKPDYFVFVHGYKVSGQAARGWNAEVFKRLHRLGFNGRFVGVTWHGDTGLDYHHAVYNAFRTSIALDLRLKLATPFRNSMTVAGHSLGNMVVSNAIAEGGLQPTRYYMLNAAVPIEAYDSTQVVDENQTLMSQNMTEVDWKDYPTELYAANWHKLFGNDDGRATLSWNNRFTEVVSTAYNFYSPGEEVVEDAVDGESVGGNLLDRLSDFLSGQGLGRHAWVMQEIGKGCKNLISWFGFRVCSAGWDFNGIGDDLDFVGDGSRYSAEEAENAWWNGDLTGEELAQFGFFRKFKHHDQGTGKYASIYAPIATGVDNIGHNTGVWEEASQLAGDPDTQWYLLATGIPSMSFAVAANYTQTFDDTLTGGINRNVNMEQLRNDAGLGWPEDRIKSNWDNRWLHSDFRNVAMPYVHMTFEKMLEIGGLKE